MYTIAPSPLAYKQMYTK